jgi:hypothetical protein
MPVSHRLIIVNIVTAVLLIAIGIFPAFGLYYYTLAERIEGILFIAFGVLQLIIVFTERKNSVG